jgi:hypothetical protein
MLSAIWGEVIILSDVFCRPFSFLWQIGNMGCYPAFLVEHPQENELKAKLSFTTLIKKMDRMGFEIPQSEF